MSGGGDDRARASARSLTLSPGTHVAIFHSLTRVMGAEACLRRARIPHRLIPTPRPLSSSCGLAIVFPPGDLARVREELTRARLEIVELHVREATGYAPVDAMPNDTERSIAGRTLVLSRGDITSETVDAIVNAANPSLLGGGGVDGAIHHRGGPAILAECRAIRERSGPCPTGEAVITGAGELAAKHVIHAVGPIYDDDPLEAAELLASAYRASLARAVDAGLASIAFPSISTGAYGYPEPEAAPIALGTVVEHLRGETTLREVRFVLFADSTLQHYREALDAILPRATS